MSAEPATISFPLVERLPEIAEKAKRGQYTSVTVRELLSWYFAERRGHWIVAGIRRALDQHSLTTEPNFEDAYIDAQVRFVPKPEVPEQLDDFAPPFPSLDDGDEASSSEFSDPTFRISKLEAANRSPVSIPSSGTVMEAVTLMLSYDYSQLPVMDGERDVKGVISWRSIGARRALGNESTLVRDMMDPHQELRSSESLFAAIPVIAEHDYVLIRDRENRISGIVTAADLSLQFQQLSEPFLLLSEIENHVRVLTEGKFTPSELSNAKDPSDSSREITSPADLTFGEYLRLLENPDSWTKLGLSIDRKVFILKLDRIRMIRNDVMHFDPDGISPENLTALRGFARFMQRLHALARR